MKIVGKSKTKKASRFYTPEEYRIYKLSKDWNELVTRLNLVSHEMVIYMESNESLIANGTLAIKDQFISLMEREPVCKGNA
jgi:hypothetical protein